MTESGEAEEEVSRNLIQLLHVHERPQDSHVGAQSAERVFEALRVRLSSVLGASGYSTLLARSLALTRAEFPWLMGLVADKDGSLVGRLGPTTQERGSLEAARGFAALLTRFITLLTTFIGVDLTNRLLAAVWRDLETGNADGSRGENNS